jgi:hypothetical protein
MKPINKDAKLLIRSYIDNIEEYLKTKSKMHPNIIDGILNEINDFVYIRSTELAKDKIVYSDVLKAIEECGSPSDICDQYLEDDIADTREINKTQTLDEKSRPLLLKKVSKKDNSENTNNISSSIGSSYSYLDQLEHFSTFGLYRILSLFIYTLLVLFVITNADLEYSYHSYQMFYLEAMQYICTGISVAVIFWVSILFLLEGWLIGDWKNRMKIKGFDRKNDDRVLIIVSRVAVLVLSLKISLLPLPQYFFIIFPILFILLLWMERQLASKLWVTKFSITINKLAHSVETGTILAHIRQSFNDLISSINARSNLEKYFFVFSTFILVFNWLFPSFYGWDTLIFPFEIFYNPNISFSNDGLIHGVNTSIVLSFILLIGGFIVTNVRAGNLDNTNYKLVPLNIWIVRIVILRSVLLVATFYSWSSTWFSIFPLVALLLLFEFSVNREQNKLIVQTVVNGLKYLGSDRKPYISPEYLSSTSVSSESTNGSNKEINVAQQMFIPQVQRNVMPDSSPTPFDEPVPILDYQSPFVKVLVFVFSAIARFIKKFISLCILALYTIAKPTYAFCKALMITSILLIGSILEVLLVIFAILTQLGTDGSYLVPVFTFDFNLHPEYESIYHVGGIMIWSWYVLAILAAQIFLLVVIEWLQFARKKDDGVIVMFFRNISRILLLIIAFGSIYQGWYYFDTYAPLRLFFIIILLIFMEITSLKIRLERKHWQVTATPVIQDIESVENDNQPN